LNGEQGHQVVDHIARWLDNQFNQVSQKHHTPYS
jgi:hypothetical protein